MSDRPENDLATDGGTDDPFARLRSSKGWLDDIDNYRKFAQDYHEASRNIDDTYANLDKMRGLADATMDREFKIFWANMEVLNPSTYARPPVPVVTSRFKDRRPILRHASELLERTLSTSFDLEDIDYTMRLARDDLNRNARGVVWLRLGADSNGSQKVCYDHVCREDFAHDVAESWKKCGWVAKRTWETKARGIERFGTKWTKAGFTTKRSEAKDEKDNDDTPANEEKAPVWEIWSKTHGVVVWVTQGVDEVLDIRTPFLQLDNFFPCPRPAFGTLEPGSLRPVPDLLYYKDQVEEINELTARISALAEGLRLKGFYSAGVEDLSDAIEAALKSNDNNAVLIPIKNTQALGGQGLKDSIIWLPIKEVAETLVALVELRTQMISDVYQITGLSDIMRGETDSKETLGAQKLKSQYGSIRIRDKVAELVRLARDMTRLAGEIMAENFDLQTMLAMSQYDAAPNRVQIQKQIAQLDVQKRQIAGKVQQAANDPQMVMKARENPQEAQKLLQQTEQQIQQITAKQEELAQTVTIEQVYEFLKDQRMRPFSLDIETDSTIQPDEDAQKQRVTEFMGVLGGVLPQLGEMIKAAPESAEFAGELLKFAISPFRVGRSLDGAIDEFVDQMKQRAGQPQQDPEMVKAQMEAQQKQADHQMEMQKAQADFKLEAQKQQSEFALKLQEMQMTAGQEQEKLAAEIEKIFAEIERIKAQTAAAKSRPEKKEAA